MRLILLVSLVLAATTYAKSPSIKIQHGTIIGTSSAGGVESFKGIPFAQPPVGQLRLRPPQPLKKSFGTIKSQELPTSCPQQDSFLNAGSLPEDVASLVLNSPVFQAATKTGEDCLTLNVQRPSSAHPKSKLPVLYWIFGGGFEIGSTQMFDGSSFVEKSMNLGEPIIFVAVNYRVSGFGFLAGDDLTKEGSTNLGLRDQRLGMQWVQDNIEAFGGDPEKVTIWGESSGSISTFDHTIINSGDHNYKGKPLFRGAMMNSGSIIPTLSSDSARANEVYNAVVHACGCSAAANKLSCLRSVDYITLLKAINAQPGFLSYAGLQLAYLPRPDPTSKFFPLSPEIAVQKGHYARVPIIVGDQEDEGTLFALAQTNVTSTNALVDYLKEYFPLASRKTVARVVASYPDKPSAGSPFGTGPLYEVRSQYKRLAAFLGDLIFTLARRGYLNDIAGTVPTWSYLSSAFKGTPVLGTFHASDIVSLYFGGGSVVADHAIKTHYISFVNHLDPNKLRSVLPTTNWPQWSKKGRKLMNFGMTENKVITDTFREAEYEQLHSNLKLLRV